MGKSQQLGWIVLKGKRWYGYYRKSVIDPETEDVRVNIVPVLLGLKSQMTKGAAHAALRDEIAKQTGQIGGGRVLKDGSVTFEWFVHNLLSASAGGLATGNGEGEEGADRDRLDCEVRYAVSPFDRQIRTPDACEPFGKDVQPGSS
jgi:hypothetical protein